MRITNNMTTENTLRNINKAANRLATANEAEATQQKIQRASDDPVVATRAVAYRSYVSQISQYQDTATAATAWQKATDAALSDLNDVLTQVKTLATSAASTATMSDTDRAGIKTSIETLRTQAISIMNTDYCGRYIFGGYSTNEAPYQSVTTTIGDSVTFKDGYVSLGGAVSSQISDADIESFYTANASSLYSSTTTSGSKDQSINYNIGFDSTVTVNTEGQDVIGEGAGKNLFDTFSKLLLALDGDTTYKTAEVDAVGQVTVTTNSLSISDLLTDLTTDASRLQVAQATLGARMDKVSTATTSLGDAYTAYKSLMSSNEDVDTAGAISEQASAEYCYEAALSVGAKANSKTLIDYLG